MYSENSNYVSDLVNSYAWDTAIVFIEKYAEGNSNYANKKGTEFSSSRLDTGKSGDVVCNIYDMAANCKEWSTEHSTYVISTFSHHCVGRGGTYRNSNYYTAYRYDNTTSYSINYVSSRPLLYV